MRSGMAAHQKPGIMDISGKRRDLSTRFRDWDYDFLKGAALITVLAAGTDFPVVRMMCDG
jgi:hypothetical protein